MRTSANWTLEDAMEYLNKQKKTMQNWIFNGHTFEEYWMEEYPSLRGDYEEEEVKAAWDSCRPLNDLQVGDEATIILWSDKYGCKITEIERTKAGKPKRIGLRKYEFQVADCYDGDGTLDKSKVYGDTQYFTLRKNGGWYAEGQPKKWGSVYCSVGYARTYRDPSF